MTQQTHKHRAPKSRVPESLSSSAERRVTLIAIGRESAPHSTVVPDTLEELRKQAAAAFHLPDCQVYHRYGAVLRDLSGVFADDLLYVSDVPYLDTKMTHALQEAERQHAAELTSVVSARDAEHFLRQNELLHQIQKLEDRNQELTDELETSRQKAESLSSFLEQEQAKHAVIVQNFKQAAAEELERHRIESEEKLKEQERRLIAMADERVKEAVANPTAHAAALSDQIDQLKQLGEERLAELQQKNDLLSILRSHIQKISADAAKREEELQHDLDTRKAEVTELEQALERQQREAKEELLRTQQATSAELARLQSELATARQYEETWLLKEEGESEDSQSTDNGPKMTEFYPPLHTEPLSGTLSQYDRSCNNQCSLM